MGVRREEEVEEAVPLPASIVQAVEEVRTVWDSENSGEEVKRRREENVQSPTSSIPLHQREGRRKKGAESPIYPPRNSYEPISMTDILFLVFSSDRKKRGGALVVFWSKQVKDFLPVYWCTVVVNRVFFCFFTRSV